MVAMLPGETSVTPAEAQRFVDSAVSRLKEGNGSVSPEDGRATDLVEEFAFAKALKRHYLKGEGDIEVPAADSEIERVEKAIADYVAELSLPPHLAAQKRAGVEIQWFQYDEDYVRRFFNG